MSVMLSSFKCRRKAEYFCTRLQTLNDVSVFVIIHNRERLTIIISHVAGIKDEELNAFFLKSLKYNLHALLHSLLQEHSAHQQPQEG